MSESIGSREAPVVTVSGLSIAGPQGEFVLQDASVFVGAGEILGLVGESGSGKTTLAHAILGHFRRGLDCVGGTISVAGLDVLRLKKDKLQRLRAEHLAYIPQNPGTALNPSLTIRALLEESFPERIATERQLLDVLAAVRLPATPELLSRYPHQLSGGQQQRVALACAFARRPSLVVLDEPTTALDVSTQSQILEIVRKLSKTNGTSAIFVSHDLAVIGTLADRVAVMQSGRIVEIAEKQTLFSAPSHPYTKQLLQALKRVDHVSSGDLDFSGRSRGHAILEMRGLTARHGRKVVLEPTDMVLREDECTALVGPSGSGKTTLARSIVGLHLAAGGSLTFDGASLPLAPDLRPRHARRDVQYIFQNSFSAFNPKRNIGDSLAAAYSAFEHVSTAELGHLVEGALADVGLSLEIGRRLPSQLSGGQRQRAAIARALIQKPRVLICDEITSALDVATQQAVIRLLRKLQSETKIALLFVTHDLDLAAQIASQIAVMENGEIVERGPVSAVFNNPQTTTTRELMAHRLLLPQESPVEPLELLA